MRFCENSLRRGLRSLSKRGLRQLFASLANSSIFENLKKKIRKKLGKFEKSGKLQKWGVYFFIIFSDFFPQKLFISSFKQNMITYCNICQAVLEIRGGTSGHICRLDDFANMNLAKHEIYQKRSNCLIGSFPFDSFASSKHTVVKSCPNRSN